MLILKFNNPTIQFSNIRIFKFSNFEQFNRPSLIWRREWDSNPRYGFTPHTHFPGVRLQPLGHLSSAPKKGIAK